MPWTPQNDFEEEVVNLQPDHDFIFGYLSEPQYPRPSAHTEYAAARKLQEMEQRKQFGTNSTINAKLRVMQHVQSIANTKPVGEQPSLDDWDTNENLEQETIGMMRHFGLGCNVEQPLDQRVTIASYPVKNTNRILRNGRRNVPLFLDDNMFKLRDKVSDTSSGFESCNNSDSNQCRNTKGDSLASELDGAASLNTSSSFSFTTAGECNDSFCSANSHVTGPIKIYEPGLNQYDKLIEETSLLSLNYSKDSVSSQEESSDSFRTTRRPSWTPLVEEDEISLIKMSDWPALSKHNTSGDTDSLENNYLLFNSSRTDSTDDISSETSNNERKKRQNFLDRFIKTDETDNLDTTSDSVSTKSSPPKPKTYASITKAQKLKSPAKQKKNVPPDFVNDFPIFYTTRKMYALKRNQK